jgi:hypothetical protein
MEKPLSLNILYTANIRGDLAILPRLYNFMQLLKPAERQGTLFLDLGDSCADDVWHCGVTGGRSTLIVLDGMGYHAARVDLADEERAKIEDVVTMGLVDDKHDWHYHIPPVIDDSICITNSPQKNDSLRLQIHLKATQKTAIQGKMLTLQTVEAGQVGMVTVDLSLAAPRLIHTEIRQIPSNIHPNPTIVASVDFVESEARFFQNKQSGLE